MPHPLKSGWAVDIDDVLASTTANLPDLYINDDFIATLPLMLHAHATVWSLHRHRLLSCYLTSRLPVLRPLTLSWLKSHHLPPVPLIMRPETELSRTWKIAYLTRQHFQVTGLIDDDLEAFINAPPFTGKKVWLNTHHLNVSSLPLDILEIPNWSAFRHRFLP